MQLRGVEQTVFFNLRTIRFELTEDFFYHLFSTGLFNQVHIQNRYGENAYYETSYMIRFIQEYNRRALLGITAKFGEERMRRIK